MSTLLIIVVLLLLFGGGFGYYGHQQWGPQGGIGVVGIVLVVIVLVLLFGGGRFWMDPNTLVWVLSIIMHGGSAQCCVAQAQVAIPAIECKVPADAKVCTVSAYEICKRLAEANREGPAMQCLAVIPEAK